jgi:hypothetical protein
VDGIAGRAAAFSAKQADDGDGGDQQQVHQPGIFELKSTLRR